MKYISMKSSLALIGLAALSSTTAHADAARTNIALNQKVIFETIPRYALTTDEGDATDLTDGRYSTEGDPNSAHLSDGIWVRKSTVGWFGVQPVIFSIDLGSVRPISGFSFSTAAGRAGVQWPSSIYVAVSDDQQKWHYIGDLTQLTKTKVPDTDIYRVFRYIVDDLNIKGRYVTFGFTQLPFSFVDEVEVFEGKAGAVPDMRPYPPGPKMSQLVADIRTTDLARNRMTEDLQSIRKQLSARPIPAPQRNALSAKLDRLASVVAAQPRFTAPMKTILPLNNLHREMLAVHGEALGAQKVKPLTIWKQHRYRWLPLVARPTATEKPQIDISMLKNQFRSDAILLTNATGKPTVARLSLLNPPPGDSQKWLKVSRTEWTDTTQNVPVPDALIPLTNNRGTYTVEIPAGMTLKLFMTVNSSHLPKGNYRSALRISSGSTNQQVPFNVTVSGVAMKKPRLSTGTWDYTSGIGGYGITPANRDAAMKMMGEYFINSPWSSSVANQPVLPMPDASYFDSEGRLIKPLDFTGLKQWVAEWPNAKRFFVYVAVNGTFADAEKTTHGFAGAAIGTPEFYKRVVSWAKAVGNQMQQMKLRPEQLVLLLVDEPQTDVQDAIIAAWAKAINEVTPKITLFQDPSWERPDQTKIQEAITDIDILCPDLSVYRKAGEPVAAYYEKLRQSGKELWFYQCSGPIRLYDPQLYYRYQPWHAFSVGATGQGFWAFGDIGGAPTSWHDYAITGQNSYAPAFIDTKTVYSSLHLEALREGVEDYEELAMLKDYIARTTDAKSRSNAEKLLNDSVKAVTSIWDSKYQWQAQTSPELADANLKKIRMFLESAQKVK